MRTRLPLPDFSATRILVVGDVMLDKYWYGETQRISPEAPIQVVNMQGDTDTQCLGGAANVAANLAALGVVSRLIGLVGDDADAVCIEDMLVHQGVQHDLVRVADSRTIVKSRVVSRNQQLLRLDYEDGFAKVSPEQVEARFVALLPTVDAVILSDYAKGCLRNVGALIEQARRVDTAVFVDPKSKDFSIYSGATLLTPNLHEFNVAVGQDCHNSDELGANAQAMCEQLNLQALLITRGEQGMSLIVKDKEPIHLPAETHEVYDTTGAGDTVISMFVASYATGSPYLQCARLANKAASIVVTKVGTAVVKLEELASTIEDADGTAGICSQEKLLSLVQQARQKNQSIVMTNGCFDLLHGGHIEYLKQAASKGDKLIVAVNDDASLRSLKGDDRPVRQLAERMALLAALGVVDWVVSFSDDTPAQLIEQVCPDVLVKGGDYKPEQVVGFDAVTASGGKVIIVDYIEGFSTSHLISQIRNGR